ncbi:MAG: nucleoside recognition protein [Lachnospiraceae bacterium]|nr:nucleoside recognition protein [Lachnospiraceae bacterium]
MLNYIWSFLIITGIIYASFTGQIEGLNESIISSAKDAVDLLILMAGVIGMWSGFLNIAEESGLTKYLSEKMRPLLHFLFPNIPKNHEANDYICANFIANILGLGWACTPTGLKAMKALKKLHEDCDTASDEMCTFLILNISSLQIIPMNMIAYRASYGSPSPMAVIAPGLISTAITTILAVIICTILTKKRDDVRRYHA